MRAEHAPHERGRRAAPRAISASSGDASSPTARPRAGSCAAARRARSCPGPAALFNKVFTTKGKLRLLREPFVAPRPASLEDESVHSFFARRFGEEAALYGAGRWSRASTPATRRSLSIRSAFPRLWEAEGAAGSVIRGFLRRKEKVRQAGSRTATQAPGAASRANPHVHGGLFTLVETLQSASALSDPDSGWRRTRPPSPSKGRARSPRPAAAGPSAPPTAATSTPTSSSRRSPLPRPRGSSASVLTRSAAALAARAVLAGDGRPRGLSGSGVACRRAARLRRDSSRRSRGSARSESSIPLRSSRAARPRASF